jgi:radical SAM superfamily enzyme YgiQ (UPF0313 family)
VHKHQKISDIERCAKALARHKIRLIASLVLGIDTDSKEDIQHGVDFARDIHAYQLQPAILTPFYGTETYQQYESEGRMLTKNWEVFDLTNVTFQPKNMTPWELQKQFLLAVRRFYTFFSSFPIMRLFGFKYALRRQVLALAIRWGTRFLRLEANVGKNTYLYALKHGTVN